MTGTHWTKADHEIIASAILATESVDWDAIATALGRSKKACKTYAYRYGLIQTQPRSLFWTTEQTDALYKLCEIGLYTLPGIERRFNKLNRKQGWPRRTAGAIFHKAKAAGFSFNRSNLAEWLTIPAISSGLGHRTTEACRFWVHSGRLPSTGGGDPGNPYLIRVNDFVNFALENPTVVCNYQLVPEGAEWLLMLIRDVAVPKSRGRQAA
jgi:hypothetical protein